MPDALPEGKSPSPGAGPGVGGQAAGNPETASPEAASPAAIDRDTESRVRVAAAAALDRQAGDLRVLELTEVSDFTDYFVICDGANERQVEAIAEAVERKLRSCGARPLHLEGADRGQWVLLDYGDLIVHVFDARRRGLYRLERLWSDAPDRTADLAPA